VIAADHLNKADLAANIARDMIDIQGVEMIYDVAASPTALAAGEIAKARNKIIMFNGCQCRRRHHQRDQAGRRGWRVSGLMSGAVPTEPNPTSRVIVAGRSGRS
jgi:hypothetical protein